MLVTGASGFVGGHVAAMARELSEFRALEQAGSGEFSAAGSGIGGRGGDGFSSETGNGRPDSHAGANVPGIGGGGSGSAVHPGHGDSDAATARSGNGIKGSEAGSTLAEGRHAESLTELKNGDEGMSAAAIRGGGAPVQFEVFSTWQSSLVDLPGVHMIQLDLTDPTEIRDVVRQVRPDVIIHCAAQSNLDAAHRDPDLAFQINVRSTEILAQEAEALGSRVIFTSSDMVFDGKRGGYAETDETSPVNVYGVSKAKAEVSLSGLSTNWVVARLALVYGRPRGGGGSFSEWIRKRMENDQPVPLFHDQYRTPILVNNLAELLLELAIGDFVGIIHLGGPDRIDRVSFAQKMAARHRLPTSGFLSTSMFDHIPEAERPQDVSLDIGLAQRLLKTPILGVDEGIEYA